MKPKEVSKKLTLKKHTISHLDDKQQDVIRGGTIGNETRCIFGDCIVTIVGETCCGSAIDCSC